MHHNERSLPNVPNLSRPFDASSPLHHEVLQPFSRNTVLLAPHLRKPTGKSALQGHAHLYPPLPTSSQQHYGIHRTAWQQQDGVPHQKYSPLSILPCDRQTGTQTRHWGAETVRCRAIEGACRCEV